MVFFSIPDAETAAACYRDLMLSSNRLNKLMLDILDAGYPAAPGMLVEYHFLLKRVNDLLFEFNVLELEGEQRDFFLKRRPELKGLFDDQARNEVMDCVYLHDEDGGRPDIKDAFLLELTAMRKPYSSLLDDFSGLPLNREQEEWLAFSGQVSIRISRMEFFLRRMAGICGRASVEGLKKHWEWVRNHEKEMVCVARMCEEMFSSLSPEDPLVELFVVIDARL